ncbi:hypothetical protein CN918_31270 [Priestia megaterium]|nr:hypothetical protein CN918_31270 [Priestia megaterium]
MEKVLLANNGYDKHENNCGCGLCDRNGKSYGVALFDVSNKNLNVKNEDAVFDFVSEEEPFLVEYAASEDSAYENARSICKEKHAEIVYQS